MHVKSAITTSALDGLISWEQSWKAYRRNKLLSIMCIDFT